MENNNLLNISLIQGKQFNNYQHKIQRSKRKIHKNDKEGFDVIGDNTNSILQNNIKTTTQINKSNTKELNDINTMQQQYQDLFDKYISIKKTIDSKSLETINRMSDSNPLLNKTISFTTGQLCYVTNQGIAKYIPSQDIFDSLAISKTITPINIPWNEQYNGTGMTIPTQPPLITGTPITMGESLGHEGVNVYVSNLIDNPTNSYVGCYNGQPPTTETNIVPLMSSSNTVDEYDATSSSVYNNNNTYGPWRVFDNNVNTFWHSNTANAFAYDNTNGIYKGTTTTPAITTSSGQTNIAGEWIQITFPNLMPIQLTKYSLQGRQDCCGTPNGRNPNTWYLCGLKDKQWFQIDNQTEVSFTKDAKTFTVNNPQAWSGYRLIFTKTGDPNATKERTSIQISKWNLLSNTSPSGNNAMDVSDSALGHTSFDKCQEYAQNNNFQYFAMQDYQGDNKGKCVVSNNITNIKEYGDATEQISALPLWSSNTAGTNASHVYVNTDGTLTLVNDSQDIIWQSPSSLADCAYGGKMNPTNITATYGANCNNNDSNVEQNNAYAKVKELNEAAKFPTQLSLGINNTVFGDPSPGCSKSWDTSYQCGTEWKTAHIDNAEGQQFIYDCKQEAQSCVFFVILQNDGNMALYRGQDITTNNNTLVWSSGTNKQQQNSNVNWAANKSTSGKNHLKLGEGLYKNEWIGSLDGSLKLILQDDGNLVLYTSQIKPGCEKIDNTYYGNGQINAVYKINSVGNKSNLGKIGYVNANSELQAFPESMTLFANDYQIETGYDSFGNDINSIVASNIEGCQDACNSTADCAGFAYHATTNSCWTKNREMYPKGDKQLNDGTILGVRKNIIQGSTTCSNKINNIDTIQWEKYAKGDQMSDTTRCNPPYISQEDNLKYDNIKSKLSILGADIAAKMENLYAEDTEIYKQFGLNSEEFKKNVAMYKNINKRVEKELETYNIEGMTNLNMNDISGMYEDSSLRVESANYNYIFWTVAALIILTITVKSMKK